LHEFGSLPWGILAFAVEHEVELALSRPAIGAVPATQEVIERLTHAVAFPPARLDEHARSALPNDLEGPVRRVPVDDPHRDRVSGGLELGLRDPLEDMADRAFLV